MARIYQLRCLNRAGQWLTHKYVLRNNNNHTRFFDIYLIGWCWIWETGKGGLSSSSNSSPVRQTAYVLLLKHSFDLVFYLFSGMLIAGYGNTAKMQRHRQNTNVVMLCHTMRSVTLALTRHRLPRNEDQRRGAGGIGSFLNKLSWCSLFMLAERENEV